METPDSLGAEIDVGQGAQGESSLASLLLTGVCPWLGAFCHWSSSFLNGPIDWYKESLIAQLPGMPPRVVRSVPVICKVGKGSHGSRTGRVSFQEFG